jgi:hypothetical protein
VKEGCARGKPRLVLSGKTREVGCPLQKKQRRGFLPLPGHCEGEPSIKGDYREAQARRLSIDNDKNGLTL